MTLAGMFRPAMFVAYHLCKTRKQNKSTDLGATCIWSIRICWGPALEEFIMGIGYKGLFWVDGSSCVIAIIIFALLVKKKKVK
jgi:hypothetical protein